MLIVAVVIAVVAVLVYARRLATNAPRISPQNKAILVTGCDTGFGHELSKCLHGLGFIVFSACLDANGEGALQLKEVGKTGRLHIIQMDVTREEQVSDAAQTVTDLLTETTGLWAVVNNAGLSTFGDVEFCGLDIYQRIANVNLWGTVRVCKAFLPLLRKSKGRVINVTSVLGRQSSKGRSCYVATKYALEGFTQCLRYEMRDWGISVIIIEPGNYIAATGIFTQDKIDRMRDEMWSSMSDEVKDAYGEALFKSRVDRMRHFTRVGDTDTRPVLNAMVAAVMDANPRMRYEPKTFYWLVRTFIMTVAPYQVGDYLYHTN